MNNEELENRIKELETALIVEKRVTQSLKEDETKFQSIANNITTHIAYVNADILKYEFVNSLFEKSFGIPRDKIIGSHIKDVIGETNYKFALKYINEVKLGKSCSYENTFNLTSGKRWIQVKYSPVFDDTSKVVGIAVVSYDITERKQAEEALMKSNQLLRDTGKMAKVGGWEFDVETLEQVWTEEVYHIHEVDMTYKPTVSRGLNFYNPISKPIIERAVQRAIEYGEPYAVELELVTAKGNLRWVHTIGKADQEHGKVFGTFQDITEHKLVELLLKESETKLRQLNADKDRFISILGHDLKSPFNNLLGLSELLTKNIHNYDIDKIEKLATNINKSARNTFNLLENILTWANAQQGNIPFKPQILSFADICKNVLEILRPSADAKNITINDSSLDHLTVYADADMLKTILRNLVSNAIKFTNSGGEINISGEQTDSNATISVSDNGIGILLENLVKIFEISEVLTTKGTKKESGTGLGLLLCKEFVEKHGGIIWVESEVGKGSDFKFTLPCNAESKPI